MRLNCLHGYYFSHVSILIVLQNDIDNIYMLVLVILILKSNTQLNRTANY